MRSYQMTSPLMRGDEVKTVQRRLAGVNHFKENYRPGPIDGMFGEATAAASYRAKYALGYPKDALKRTYGPTLDKYLTGKVGLPADYAKRRRDRKQQATTVTPLRQKALKIARDNLGVAESPPASNRVKFSAWYGLTGPWCAMFVSYCYDTQGSKAFLRGSRYSYVGAITAAARVGGRGLAVVRDPQPGDIVCWGDYHTGLFEAWTSTGFNSIEGNYANKVSRVTHSRGNQVFVRVTN
jgi:peptidoglycan hydrolase-like protein with peptidoglycan-binding domain